MDQEKDQRSVKYRYANAKNVLPPDLLREVQQHVTGMLWVPANTQFFETRRKLVLALTDQGVSTREIGKLAGVTPRRVRQILAKDRASKPTHSETFR